MHEQSIAIRIRTRSLNEPHTLSRNRGRTAAVLSLGACTPVEVLIVDQISAEPVGSSQETNDFIVGICVHYQRLPLAVIGMQIDSALSTTVSAVVVRPDRGCDVWVWRDWVYILVDHFGDSSSGVQGLDEEENGDYDAHHGLLLCGFEGFC